MPCGEDWLSHPLGIVQGFFGEWSGERSLRDQACRAAALGTDGGTIGGSCVPGLESEPSSPLVRWPQVPAPARCPAPPPGPGSRAAGTQLRALTVIDCSAPG